MKSLIARRGLVTAGTVLALVIGIASIRAAAAWTAEAAPLPAQPVSMGQLSQRLADEQARSAALEDQLQQVTDQTAALAGVLTTAQDRVSGDAKQAATLRASLESAKKKLAVLTKSIKAAQKAARQRVVTTTKTRTATPAPARRHDDGGEDDD